MGNILEVILKEGFIDRNYIHIKKADQCYFPSFKKSFWLETDNGPPIKTNSGLCKSRTSCALETREGMSKWFKANPELKAGDKIRFTVLKDKKKYRLEVVK